MKKLIIVSLALSPSMLLAEGLANIGALVNYILGFINLLMPLFAGLALLYFFWGLAKFISNSGDTAGRAEGKSLMIWGLVALFVMLSFLGLIQIAKNDLGLGVGTPLPLIKR
jgi:hypothetical protein